MYGFGPRAAPERVPDGRTLFEIGSITKVFTASLLAVLVAQGRIRLDEPVRDVLPELHHFPPEITPRRLATHSSGLPRWPEGRAFTLSTLKNPANPLVAYTTEELFRWLREHAPPPCGEGRVAYSNLGMGLLGHICARTAGASYEEALGTWIARPLGLEDTSFAVPADKRARLAPPHTWRGERGSSWDLPAFEGAGGLRSTADDMLRFLAANLDPDPSRRPFTLCHEIQIPQPRLAVPSVISEVARAYGMEIDPRVDVDPRFRSGKFRMALGWVVTIDEDGHDIHWHDGATGGYRAFIGLSKREGVAVAVLANRGGTLGDTAVDDIGFGLLRLLPAAPPE